MITYLSLRGFAKRAGLAYGTVNRYYVEGRLPEPDSRIAEAEDDSDKHPRYGWLPETVDRWLLERPGRGARTDLEKQKP